MEKIKARLMSVSSRVLSAKKDTSEGPFSLRSAILATAFLTLLLCWLPVFGQITAGYVGGRKSGSAFRGAIVTGAVISVFVFIALLLSILGLSIVDLQEAFAGTIFSGMPAFSEFSISTFEYLQSIFASFGAVGSACAVMTLTTMTFGLIGGMISDQVRLEKEYIGGPIQSASVSARSIDSYKTGRSVGFGNFDDYSQVHALQVNTVTASPSLKPLVRKASAKDTPEPQPAEEIRSPLSSVLQISSERPTVQPREKPVAPKEDFEYI